MNKIPRAMTGLRNHRIDFLRGVAILLVLLLHFHFAYDLNSSILGSIFSPKIIDAIVRNGYYGVTIFFVISGFLITSMSLKRYGDLGKISIPQFYAFRFARIMPCLLLVLAIMILFNFLPFRVFKNEPNSTSLFITVLSVLTFWHNLLIEKVGYFNCCMNIFWSLSVEEVFYFTFPLACVFLKRRSFIIAFLVFWVVVSPIYRHFHSDLVALYDYFSCFDGIAIGCCFAMIAFVTKPSGRMWKIIQICAIILMVSIYLYSPILKNIKNMTVGVSLMSLGAGILLLGAKSKESISNARRLFNLPTKTIEWLGKNSYELYLFHMVVLALMREIYYDGNSLGKYGKFLWMIVFFALSATVSGVVSKFYSEPMNKKIRMIFREGT